jgi:hypothetical protein
MITNQHHHKNQRAFPLIRDPRQLNHMISYENNSSEEQDRKDEQE